EATLGEAIGSGGGGNELVAYEPSLEEGVEAPPAEPEPQQPEPEAEAPEQDTPSTASPGQAEASPEGDADGEASDPASVPVLKTSSTRRIVSVELDPGQQSIAHRGQKVEVLLPGGEEAKGEVRRIAATEGSGEEAPGEEAEPGVEVTVSITGKTKAPALDGAAVSVLFTQQVRKDVLSVPLTALLAIGGERFAVVVEEGAERRRTAVTPGLAADGYVEVEGEGLAEGMRVETGE
ncbi:MAG: hypothetical protein ACREJT_01250, partial [Myxococcota bacterium]